MEPTRELDATVGELIECQPKDSPVANEEISAAVNQLYWMQLNCCPKRVRELLADIRLFFEQVQRE